MEVTAPPAGYELYYDVLMTPGAVEFVASLAEHFDQRVDEV